MPDENRFAGLGDQLDDADTDTETTDADDAGDDVDATTDGDVDTTTDSDGASDDAGVDAPDDSADTSIDDVDPADAAGPAFEFDATRAKSIYVRPETLELLADVEFEVESILRRNHDVRDLTGREFHDALVRAVASHPEAVADLILEERDD
ncbi:hypothetical protein SAMN04487948_14313 [Halogranum amylolyticum]|uniref:Uncharacterized protein n=1 Tax=Halogranum amylolyticum TaxID=660520 RepID=A0A1H8WUI6_9EURY|nr:hypothetical protein [Halogranum amylolyticum]SEP31153.1 hypothetical protein SAMN04487948_14313 [Halogranum amylolyticum]